MRLALTRIYRLLALQVLIDLKMDQVKCEYEVVNNDSISINGDIYKTENPEWHEKT